MASASPLAWIASASASPISRRWTDSAACQGLSPGVYRYPDWSEQLIQFLTRYLFFSLGILFFNFTQNIEPVWFSRLELNIAFGVYFIIGPASEFL